MIALALPWLFGAALAASAVVAALHLLSVRRPPELLLPTARFLPERDVRAISRTRRPSDLLLLAEWAPEQARTALAALAMPSTGNGAQRRDHALVQAWATLFADESDARVAAAMATLDGSTRAWSARLADADADIGGLKRGLTESV